MTYLLSLLTFLPLAGAIVISLFIKSDSLVSKNNAKITALFTSIATWLISLVLLARFDPNSSEFQLVEEYKSKFGDPYVAARNGWLDDVIEPEESRLRLIRALRILSSKREWSPPKKHGNIPL